MAGKAVFVDRDKTLIEDPGYIGDPKDVKLLPGVELAIRSLHQGGYKVIVVTNQSGVARGLLTEQTLQAIHAEMRRQLRAKGVHLDGVYYCPYHPAGTVEKYARDSDLRKPKPGMLLKAAADMDVDLTASWMVGDSARDVEAGARAGCRTVRIHSRPSTDGAAGQSWNDDESVQADFTVRNLVDAAKVILRERFGPAVQSQDTHLGRDHRPAAAAACPAVESAVAESPAAKPADGPQPEPGSAAQLAADQAKAPDDSSVRQEILRYVRQMVVERQVEEFSFTKLMGGVVQMLALLTLMLTFLRMLQEQLQASLVWGVITVALQVMSLTFFMMRRSR